MWGPVRRVYEKVLPLCGFGGLLHEAIEYSKERDSM